MQQRESLQMALAQYGADVITAGSAKSFHQFVGFYQISLCSHQFHSSSSLLAQNLPSSISDDSTYDKSSGLKRHITGKATEAG
jgi:hypothetical protein